MRSNRVLLALILSLGLAPSWLCRGADGPGVLRSPVDGRHSGAVERSFPLTRTLSLGALGERPPLRFCAPCAPEPTPGPSQEGSNTGWPVPLLGGVRGGLVGARFMGRACAAPCSPCYGLLRRDVQGRPKPLCEARVCV